jgi:hypothetical protein
MAIPNYTPPQLNIDQVLDISTPGTPTPLNAVVIGPRYLLSRYGQETDTPGYAFQSDGEDIAWQYDVNGVPTNLPATYNVDTDTVALSGVGLEASLADFPSGDNDFYLASLSTPAVIKLTADLVKSDDPGDLNAAFYGRNVALGDIVYVNDGVSGELRRTVVGFEGVDIAAHYGSNGDSDNELFANSALNPANSSAAFTQVSAPVGFSIAAANISAFNGLVAGALYNGQYGDLFTLTVRTGGAPGTATFDVSSASGLFSATNVASTNSTGNYAISSVASGGALCGVNLVITPTGNVVAGDVYTFTMIGAYAQLSTTQMASNTSAVYAGTYDTVYTIEVLEGTASGVAGGVVRITSTNGVDPTTEVTLAANTFFNVGAYGLQAKFNYTSAPTQGGLRTGDVYYINAFAASKSTIRFDKVVLNGPASNTALFTNVATPISVEFRLGFTGSIAADDGPTGSPAWQATEDALEVNSALSLYVAARSNGHQWVNYADAVGTLYPSYRALVPAPTNNALVPIEDVADITTGLGSIDISNPIAYGAYQALIGAGGLIYALQTGGTDAEDFTTALTVIQARDNAYALAAMTNDIDVMGAVSAHCTTQSSETKMRWRRCYVGSDSPGSYAVLSTPTGGGNYTATVGSAGDGNTLVTNTTAGVDFTTLDIDPGDLLRLPSEDADYEIEEVLSATELLLVTGPSAPISPAVPYQIWKANTPQSQATFIINRSKALNSRRASHIWQENGTKEINGVATIIPNQFVAAEIAGIRTAVLPQQGLTRRVISAITSCPAMYTRYSDELLNEIASNGTWIITQDVESGDVYVRQQLTTDPNNGILYYEDSVGVNVDSVAFGLKALLGGYIGRYNVNRRTVNLVQAVIANYLQDLTTADVTTTIGPQLNGVARLEISIPAGQADTINVLAQVYVPVPLNKILVTLQASIDPLTGIVSTSITAATT